MHVALATSISALQMIFFASAQVVPHVVGENAIFNESVFLAVMTFVINANGTPFAAHGAVINKRDER